MDSVVSKTYLDSSKTPKSGISRHKWYNTFICSKHDKHFSHVYALEDLDLNSSVVESEVSINSLIECLYSMKD